MEGRIICEYEDNDGYVAHEEFEWDEWFAHGLVKWAGGPGTITPIDKCLEVIRGQREGKVRFVRG